VEEKQGRGEEKIIPLHFSSLKVYRINEILLS
jgi:hypothetical protein